MVLEINCRTDISTIEDSKITITYTHANDCTVVDVNADVVTLGIAVTILTDKFAEALEKLKDPVLADEIRKLTGEEIYNYEKHRSENTEPRLYFRR